MKTLTRACLLAATAMMAVAAPAHAGYTTTKSPIVLVHGIFGFNNFLGADYFYGVRDTLAKEGAVVYTSTVSAAGSNENRGEQLRAELKRLRILNNNPTMKFNLVGHSQGSPTIRYVAAVEPGLVASVTSVGGVNKGSAVADIVRKVAPAGTYSESVINSVSNAFAGVLAFATGSSELPQSSVDALNSLTTPGLAKFNAKYPAGVPTTSCGEGANVVKNIRYYSWGGSSTVTNVLDPLDAGIGTLGLAFVGQQSDGLVSACSQKLGKVLRVDYKMNHLDEVNGFFGIVHLFETNPKSVYRAHANRLQVAGL
jgi:triacylglycerol lipase